MSADDTWVEVQETGKILVHTENDGWRFMRLGPEHRSREISLDEVKQIYPHYYPQVVKRLAEITKMTP